MIIAELLKELRKHDPSLRVVMDGYEGGFVDVRRVETTFIALNVHNSEHNNEIFGPHEIADAESDFYSTDNHMKVHAVYLPRRSQE